MNDNETLLRLNLFSYLKEKGLEVMKFMVEKDESCSAAMQVLVLSITASLASETLEKAMEEMNSYKISDELKLCFQEIFEHQKRIKKIILNLPSNQRIENI